MMHAWKHYIYNDYKENTIDIAYDRRIAPIKYGKLTRSPSHKKTLQLFDIIY